MEGKHVKNRAASGTREVSSVPGGAVGWFAQTSCWRWRWRDRASHSLATLMVDPMAWPPSSLGFQLS